MEEKLLETIVSSFVKTIFSEGKALFDDLYDKSYDQIKQFIGKDIQSYLTKQKEKYSYIKTLLRGNTPVYLYDVYYPLKLQNEDDIVINTNSSFDLFNIYNFITVIGDAGSGKSTLVKHLFLNSIFERKKIPILIELRYLNNASDDLETYVKRTISQNKLAVNTAILEKLLDKGKFILFLDGFDELDERTKEKLVKQINDFVNKFNSNYYLVTSRPYSNIENLPLFTNLKMKALSLENGEIKGFVFKQLGEEKELAEKAIISIEQGESKYIHSFLKNPLLLSLYLLTFQNYASIPDKKYIFYRRVINALFSEHDSKTKLGFVREKLCGLDQEGFENVLKSFSFLSYFENEFSFNRDYINLKLKYIKEKKELNFDNNKFLFDLKSAISLWVDDEGIYSFAHRSLQEYFTAIFITELKDEKKLRVYDKIIKKFERSESSPSRELENLLQLLKEMDEYNYIKNFYQPLLYELNEGILLSKHKSEGFSYLRFFMNGIGKSKRKRDYKQKQEFILMPLINDRIYRTIYIHLKFTRDLYEFLVNSLKEEALKKHYNNLLIPTIGNPQKLFQVNNFDEFHLFTDEQFDEFYNFLDLEQLNHLVKEITSFIHKEMIDCKNYISKTDSTEKDLVDLI